MFFNEEFVRFNGADVDKKVLDLAEKHSKLYGDSKRGTIADGYRINNQKVYQMLKERL